MVYLKRRLDKIEKLCPHCGHKKAFDKKQGITCTKCHKINKGTKTLKNKYKREYLVPVL